MTREFDGKTPVIHPGAFVDETAVLIGDVEIAEGASVWPCAVLRGDMGPIRIGKNSSIQDGAVCHCTHGQSRVIVGENVAVGHGAVLHGCIIDDNCVIGMRSVIMDNAHIGSWSLVAAGAVVTQNKEFAPKSVIGGMPAKLMKEADEKTLKYIEWNNGEYRDAVKKMLGK